MYSRARPMNNCNFNYCFNILLDDGFGAGQAARATKQRKHGENDAKCKELGYGG